MRQLFDRLTEAALGHQSEEGAFVDPVFGFCDPRPAAEICKAMSVLGGHEDRSRRGMLWVLGQQSQNGSWEEVLPGHRNLQNSSLATSIIGSMLIDSANLGLEGWEEAVGHAAEFVISAEFTPGRFVKSLNHYADVLNVDAACAAFLATFHRSEPKEKLAAARDRALFNVARYQFKDGALPYASPVRSFPYRWHLCIPDTHYQAITLYFLMLADPFLQNPFTRISVARGILWLARSMGRRRVRWSTCRHPFSIGLTGVYAYAAYCFGHCSLPEVFGAISSTLEKAGLELELGTLEDCRQVAFTRITELADPSGALPRYESQGFRETARGVLCDLFDVGGPTATGYPLRTRTRLAFERMRRELAESRKPLVSLYFTAQTLECLSRVLSESQSARGIHER